MQPLPLVHVYIVCGLRSQDETAFDNCTEDAHQQLELYLNKGHL